jgi:hypothetical protein
MLVKDIFLFFARFPQKSGVLEVFNNGRSELPEYAQWMQEVGDLPVALLPEVKHYIFGPDAENVASAISAAQDCFMFVDYGQIENEIAPPNVRRESFLIAITIAFPGRDSHNDLAERAIKSDRALDMLCRMRHIMIQEEKCVPWLKNFQADHIITPWLEYNIMPSYGWTVMIRRQGYDMLNGK